MKKILALVLAVCLLSGVGSALAIDAGEARVVIGADLSDSQISTVYSTFGVTRGDYPELSVTNSEERTYLEGLVESSVIGTKSISCVYVTIGAEGTGLNVTTSNISWCTSEMYTSALATAGITDATVVVTAPFEVSGTAALTGVYKAYEDITGEKISDEAKSASTEELIITADLADEIGDADAVIIVNELKKILDETQNMTDDEVRSEIRRIAEEYDITISDAQVEQLLSLCRSLEGLDTAALLERVQSIQDTISKLSNVQETANNFVQGIKNIFSAIGNFFSNLFGKKS